MKTLALNMIVGSGDAQVLERCLSTNKLFEYFDEIVIVVTTNEIEVYDAAKKFTNKILRKEWTSERYPFGDFAGARNLALENTKSDYVMWLDSDDIIQQRSIDTFPKMRNILENNNFDYYFCLYQLPNRVFLRERIFKNTKSLKWCSPVHEQLTIDINVHKFANLKGFIIEHHKEKSDESSIGRNLKILEHEYNTDSQAADKYSYGKELICSGQEELGINLLIECIFDKKLPDITLACVASDISRYLFYSQNNAKLAETYARISISYSQLIPEPYVVLGDIYLLKRRPDLAERFFKIAMQKSPSTATSFIDYFEKIPADRLQIIYYNRGDLETALLYNRTCLLKEKNNRHYLELRTAILQKLTEAMICQTL